MNSVSYTKNNREILKTFAEEITHDLGAKKQEQQGSTWTSSLFGRMLTPSTTGAMGYKLGENLGWTHGAKVSNFAVDLVVGQFFDTPQPVSRWSYAGFKQMISGVAQVSIAETTKLAVTPKVLPIVSVMMGTVGSVALPAAVYLISQLYNRALTPAETDQLSKLSIKELFTLDPETGRFRDAFGVLLTEEDMKDVVRITSSYDLIYKLSEATKEIDQIMGINLRTINPSELDSFIDKSGLDFERLIAEENGFANLEKIQENKAKEILKSILDIYRISIHDDSGDILFIDGSILKEKDKTKIEAGIAVLLRSNPLHASKDIKKLIKVLAKHAALPLETLSNSDKVQMIEEGMAIKAKRMPEVFTGDSEWKNGIILAENGKYIVTRGEKKGDVIPAEEMNLILDELFTIQQQQAQEKKNMQYRLFIDPKKREELAALLNGERVKDIQDFFNSFIINKENGEHLYLNGQIMPEEDYKQFKKNLFCLNLVSGRKENIFNLLNYLSLHFPKGEQLDKLGISYQDGKFFASEYELSYEDVARCLKSHLDAEYASLESEFKMLES